MPDPWEDAYIRSYILSAVLIFDIGFSELTGFTIGNI